MVVIRGISEDTPPWDGEGMVRVVIAGNLCALVVGRDIGACTDVVIIGEVFMLWGTDIVVHRFNVVLSFGGEIWNGAASGYDMMDLVWLCMIAVWGIIDFILLTVIWYSAARCSLVQPQNARQRSLWQSSPLLLKIFKYKYIRVLQTHYCSLCIIPTASPKT